MRKHILFPLITTAIIIAILGWLMKRGAKIPQNPFKQPVKFETSSITIDGQLIYVYLADTEEHRTAGLSGWNSIEPNYGMLFIYPEKQIKPSFWMKGMEFNIDIVWISGNKVVQVVENIEAPEATIEDKDLKLYTPHQRIDYVLELNAHAVQNWSIKAGSEVDFSNLPDEYEHRSRFETSL